MIFEVIDTFDVREVKYSALCSTILVGYVGR